MKEQKLYDKIRAKCPLETMLYRNNVGTGYQGKRAMIAGREVLLEPRPIAFGLEVGSSDLIGYTEVTITPEMVGKKVAVFTAIEVKLEGKKASKDQERFIFNIRKSGGISGVAYSPDDVQKLVEQWQQDY
jgi:ribosomal protein S19